MFVSLTVFMASRLFVFVVGPKKKKEKKKLSGFKVDGFKMFASVVFITIYSCCFAAGAGMDARNTTSPLAPSCKFSIGHK